MDMFDDMDKIKKGKGQTQRKKVTINDYFRPASKKDKIRGLNLALQGVQKTGKSRFAMTMPPPVYMMDLELGDQLVYDNAFSIDSKIPYKPVFPNEILDESGGKDVRILETVVLNKKDDIDYDASIAMMFDGLDMLAGVTRGTVVVDSATLFYKWGELKWKKIKTGKDDPGTKFKYQFDWGEVTDEYFRLMMRLMAKPTHLVVIGHEDPVYDGQGKVIEGMYKGKWQKQTPHWMNMTIRFHKTYASDLKPLYGATIIDSRYALANDLVLPEISYHGLKAVMKKEWHIDILDYPPEVEE